MARKLTLKQKLSIINQFESMFPTYIFALEDIDGDTILAWTDIVKLTVYINAAIPMDRDTFISTLCHEVSHITLANSGKFATYHQIAAKDSLESIKEIRQFYFFAKYVEREVDRLGKDLCTTCFPQIVYQHDPEGDEYEMYNYISIELQRLDMERDMINAYRDLYIEQLK